MRATGSPSAAARAATSPSIRKDNNILYVGDTSGSLVAIRPAHRAVAEHHAVADAHGRSDGQHRDCRNTAFPWTPPLVFSPLEPDALYYGAQVLLKTIDGGLTWKEISPDLTGDTRKDKTRAAVPVTPENAHGARVRRDLRHRALAAQSGPDLGGQRHRPAARDRRRRPDLAERHAERPAGLEPRDADRSLAFRPRRSLGDGRPAPHGGLQAVHLPHARFRQDVDADQRRTRRARVPQRHSRGSGPQAACCMPRRSWASRCPSTTATTGSRCN